MSLLEQTAMYHDIKNHRPITFTTDGRHYRFVVKKAYDGTTKLVAYGYFEGDAPANCRVGKEYVLKFLTAHDPATLPVAAQRECYELLDYQGDHLRRLLARNDNAEFVATALKERGTFEGDVFDCLTVEPKYADSYTYLSNPYYVSVDDRLDFVWQVALGSEELSRADNAIGGHKIVAMRDIKLANAMLEMQGKRPRVRLIDFATVLLERGEHAAWGNDDGSPRGTTHKMPFSDDNTPMEYLMEDEQTYPVSDKSDVYALSMMLCSLFLKVNGCKYKTPNGVWYAALGIGNTPGATDRLRVAMQDAYHQYDAHATEDSMWFEQVLSALGCRLDWDSEVAGFHEIRRLIFKGTRLLPRDRISRREFLRRLQSIMNSVKDSRQTTTLSERPSTDAFYPTPVSVYLFDAKQAITFREDYCSRAIDRFRRECDEAIMNGGILPKILLVSYNNGGSMAVETVDEPTDSEAVIRRFILNICENSGELSADRMSWGLFEGVKTLYRLQRHYCFSGNVVVFAPTLPDRQRMETVRGLGWDGLIQTLLQSCHCDLKMSAVVGQAPSQEPWCDCEAIYGDDEEQDFYTGSDACYVLLPGGKRRYIELKHQGDDKT